MDNKKKQEIPFGAFDSELFNQEINIPEGFTATIDGNKIILTKTDSEDERIRKSIMCLVKKSNEQGGYALHKDEADNMLAWLEKQKNCEYIRKDWLEHIKQSWYKEGFIDGKYTPKEWTINDATTLNGLIDFLENGTAKLQHDLTLYANWLKTQFSPIEKQGEQKPAVFSEKKPKRMISAEAKEALYNKPAWSEEDEVKINRIVACLENLNVADNDILLKDVDWLKSLKQRIGWKPSDEQMEALFVLLPTVSYGRNPAFSLYNDLKKLKGE